MEPSAVGSLSPGGTMVARCQPQTRYSTINSLSDVCPS